MHAFYKLSHFISLTLSLFFTIHSVAQNQCEQDFSPTQSSELTESGVKGPRPKTPLDTTERTLSQNKVKFRKAYNRGFFKENERYISALDSKNPTRIKSFDEQKLVLESIDIDGNITEKIIYRYHFSDVEIVPTAMNFFKSLESTLAKVGPVKYPPFNKEAQMIEKGFKKEMFQGLNEAYKMNYLANHLRKSKVNPYKTHIADFSDQISEHIRLMREGLKKRKGFQFQGYKYDFVRGSKLLDELALEALKKQKEKGVTYAWWLEWNIKLAHLVSDLYLYKKNKTGIESLIEQFPDFVALPSFEDLGTMAMNKLISENVFPLGLVNEDTLVHNRMNNPYEFFRHDMVHIDYITDTYILNEGSPPYGERSFMANKEFYEKIQNLPAAQQLQAEIVYFMSTHESGAEKDHYELVPDSSFLFYSFMKERELVQLLPEDVRSSKETIRSYLKKARTFYTNLLTIQNSDR